MTVKTREEYAALHKQAEKRAIIIAEQQRRGKYRPSPSQESSGQSARSGFHQGFMAVFDWLTSSNNKKHA